ncbi:MULTISPECIES: hypothetical protein [unclassified Psychrobacter]|uniref:hypothetical protein n=1 Tax=unclassified Psychrobacter TaxID=196806 RepID=UPI0025E73415|nr:MULTISPECIES: hypothetical protein [unclassified Psychrobacter]
MKKNLTVGMPLAVPTQKRPPSKYASHPYPTALEGAYVVTTKPLTISRRDVLKISHEYESYITLAKPKSIAVRSALISFNAVPEAYTVSAKPKSIDIKLPLVVLSTVPEAYTVSAKPKSISSKSLLIKYYPKDEAYVITAKPLSIKIN